MTRTPIKIDDNTTLYPSDFARALNRADSTDAVAEFLETIANTYANHFGQGKQIGQALQGAHRTLQGCVVKLCLGILVGIADGVDLRYGTDPRNRQAIETCKLITQDIEDDRLPMQPFI